MEQRSSWEFNSRSAAQDIPRLISNPRTRHRTLSWVSWIHSTPSHHIVLGCTLILSRLRPDLSSSVLPWRFVTGILPAFLSSLKLSACPAHINLSACPAHINLGACPAHLNLLDFFCKEITPLTDDSKTLQNTTAVSLAEPDEVTARSIQTELIVS
jgi:hypothetical protein